MDVTVVDIKTIEDEPADSRAHPLQDATKSTVIDQELHCHGMGRYQWLIWGICSSGFFLDVLWVQAFGLASPNIQRELGFSDKEFGNIGAAFSAGIIAGAFTWGILVDIIGRRVAFLGTSLVAGVFGMCLGALSSYNSLLVMIALTGFGVGGNIPMDSTITAEFIPEDRHYLLTALAMAIPLGIISCTLIAFELIPSYSCSETWVSCNLTGGVTPCCSKDANMGWRYFFFAIASITLGIFVIRFFIFPFYESPRFLLAKGNDQGAVEVVRKIAAFNNHACDLTVESLYERCKDSPVMEEVGLNKRQRLHKEISRLRLLFGNRRISRVAIHVWVTWMFDCLGYYTAITYLPTILQRKNSAINVGLRKTYIDYLYIYISGFFGVIVAIMMVRAPMVGRKWTLVFSSALLGMALFLFTVVNTEANYVGINSFEYFFQCLFNSTLYGWTPEGFPTAVRGTATGIAVFLGNTFGVCGPLIAAQLLSLHSTNGENAVLFLAGSSVFVCTLTLLFLPTKDMVAPR